MWGLVGGACSPHGFHGRFGEMAQPKHHSVERAIDGAVDDCADRAFAFLDALVREPSVPGAVQGAEYAAGVRRRPLGRVAPRRSVARTAMRWIPDGRSTSCCQSARA